MKFTTVIVSVLAAFASAAAVPVADPEPGVSIPQDAAAIPFGALAVPLPKLVGLAKCFKKHKGYKVDFSKEKEGIVSVNKLDTRCCDQTENLYNKYKKDMSKWGSPVFSDPCTGFTVAGVSQKNIAKVKKVLKRIKL